MKQYTPLRQFYAIVGFTFIVCAVVYVAITGVIKLTGADEQRPVHTYAEDGSIITDPAMYWGEIESNYQYQIN